MERTLEQAIADNRKRNARVRWAHKTRTAILLRYYDYEDEGKLEKYRRVRDKLIALIDRGGRSAKSLRT
jgi:hypothetical protein